MLALECSEPAAPLRASVDREVAAALGDLLARDIARLAPSATSLDLVLVGALFDQAQVLRPHWPVHGALSDAPARFGSAQSGGNVIAFGTHDSRLPLPALQPDLRLFGSPLLVLPWLLTGPADRVAAVGAQLERELLETGLVDASLALALADAFGLGLDHARHLTVLDLCALASAQYAHAGLDGIWHVIEQCLLRGGADTTASLGDGSAVRLRDGEVKCTTGDARLRAQVTAILAAHGITAGDAHGKG